MKAIHPNWSPDSRSILYCTDDDLKPPNKNSSEIYSIELTSRKITKLISGGVNTYPVWSPDGKRIAFRRMLGENNSEVFIANSDGTDIRNLTNDPAFDGWPAWSPDGTKIAFASNRNRNYEIYIMNPDGSAVQKVAGTEGRATAPQWAKDGKTIYFPICTKAGFAFDCQIFAARIDAFLKYCAHRIQIQQTGRSNVPRAFHPQTIHRCWKSNDPSRQGVLLPSLADRHT